MRRTRASQSTENSGIAPGGTEPGGARYARAGATHSRPVIFDYKLASILTPLIDAPNEKCPANGPGISYPRKTPFQPTFT
ncbi:hypothetical protein Bxe_A0884 [Paraburkholderia xenovorans LB400]|uniref:Uncharacterized protein n=1 Tax=Paraburkholderia xenovorans (strain LB400) TaxID=266265 RepID=Q13V28_PARXL|nr:hypothetical protein Bxe_A0884 [Paraburkholderia xenovorans LB400]